MNFIESNVKTFELKINESLSDYDKGIMSNFKVITEAFNQAITDYDTNTGKKFSELEQKVEKIIIEVSPEQKTDSPLKV